MASIDVIRSCLDSLQQVSEEISDAVLFVDAGTLEAFQFLGAVPLLVEFGARAVCSLENVSPLDTVCTWNSSVIFPSTKMVVFTSCLLSDAHRYILRCLTTHQTILRCTIFTSISECVSQIHYFSDEKCIYEHDVYSRHFLKPCVGYLLKWRSVLTSTKSQIAHSAYVDSPLGPDAFHEYESLLLQDYEELTKKPKIKKVGSLQPVECGKSVESKSHQKGSAVENECWAHLPSSEDETPSPGSTPVVMEAEGASPERSTAAQLVISVHHFPLILCPLSPNVFVLPSEGAVSEACLSNDHDGSLSPGLPPMATNLSSDNEDTPPGATLTAHLLYHLAAKMDLKMEIFSLGVLSKIIGKIITDMSSLYDVGRRNRKSVGLLLIDRTLDLITPCSHGDSVVDRMLSSLPRRERTASSARSKMLQNANHHLPHDHLQRASLDVQIPIEGILGRKSQKLLDSISAFNAGWDIADFELKSGNKETLTSFDLGLLSGSLVSTDNYRGAPYVEAILDRSTKDGILLIKKWLLESLRKERMMLDMESQSGLVELHDMVKMLASNEKSLLRNKGIIQLASAALISLTDPHASHWDASVSAERMLWVSAGDTCQSLLNQIHDLLNNSISAGSKTKKNIKGSLQGGLLSFQNALVLAAIGYILAGEFFPTSGSAGPFSWEEERSLKEAIVDSLIENPPGTAFRFLSGLQDELEANFAKRNENSSALSTMEDFDDRWGSWGDEETDINDNQAYGEVQLKLELRDRVDQLFKVCHKLSSVRRRIPALREGFFSSDSSIVNDTSTDKGLLYKLLSMVLGGYDVPGLEYHASAVGRFLKSGFGRFGLGQAKPKLGDQNVLLVFVVGGINTLEVREALGSVLESGRQDIQLILGGTTLLTPNDMFDLLFGSSSFI